MDKKDLINKLDNTELPDIRIPIQKNWLEKVLLNMKAGTQTSTLFEKIKTGINITRGFLSSKQPVWKLAVPAMLVIIIVALPSFQVWTLAAEDRGGSFRIIPNINLSPYTIYKVDERISDPFAQSSEYVYLVAGKEAVILEGPEVSGEGYFMLEDPKIKAVTHGYFEDYSTEGFEVTINSHLRYTVTIDDFEGEVDLAEVRLGLKGGKITSDFIFIASESGDGVAHDILITALIDGEETGSKEARSIEVRTTREKGVQVYVKSISNGEETLLDSREGINSIPFTDFAFIVDFNSAIKASDRDNAVMAYLSLKPFKGKWVDTSVQVFARDGLYLVPLPEFDPTNEVSVTIEILDDERIMVSSVSGNFPSNAQVVLTLDFGEFRPGSRMGHTARIYIAIE